MADDHSGRRLSREMRMRKRLFQLGYYLIVTDTKCTEKAYFEGLRYSLPKEIMNNISLKVVEAPTKDLIDICLETKSKEVQNRIPWIVFDRDKVPDFDVLIRQAENNGINVAWSNPCLEVWFFAYYGSIPTVIDSVQCCSKFAELFQKKTGFEYSKSDRQLYARLTSTGDESKAIQVAKQRLRSHMDGNLKKPSDMVPCTMVQDLVEEIRKKTER